MKTNEKSSPKIRTYLINLDEEKQELSLSVSVMDSDKSLPDFRESTIFNLKVVPFVQCMQMISSLLMPVENPQNRR